MMTKEILIPSAVISLGVGIAAYSSSKTPPSGEVINPSLWTTDTNKLNSYAYPLITGGATFLIAYKLFKQNITVSILAALVTSGGLFWEFQREIN